MSSFFSRLSSVDTIERLLPWGSLLALVLVAIIPVSPLLFTSILVLNLVSSAWAVGARLIPKAPRIVHPLVGLVALLAAQSLVQTVWYYAGGLLGPASDAVSLLIPLVAFHLWETWAQPLEISHAQLPTRATFLEQAHWVVPLLLGAELLVGSILLLAKSVATDRAINSPWPLLPAGVLAAVFLLFVLSWIASSRVRSPLVTALITSSLFWSIALITPILYVLGFGFDGFLHRASEQILLSTGTLTPKPPYYLGQYVLVTWLSRICGIAFTSIDRWLVPFTAGLLPLTALAFSPKTTDRRTTFLLFAALFPLGILITTTPQSFAYLLGLAAIFLAFGLPEKRVHPFLPLLLAAWSVATHPLAGLPLALVVLGQLWIYVGTQLIIPGWLRKLGAVAAVIAISTSIPLAFARYSQTSTNRIDWHLERLTSMSTWQALGTDLLQTPITHLALWPDWADTVRWLVPFFLIGGALFAFWKRKDERLLSAFFCLSSLGLFLAGVVLSQTGEFAFLIDYERGNYAERLFLLAHLVLLPLALLGWSSIWKHIQQKSPLLIASWVVCCGALVAGQTYNALPRHDAGVIGHGWSVGTADIDAVKFIDKDARGAEYTVLANQSVSAAAVSTLGFKRYHNDVFFYPIPTGGPLYQLFLEATAIPSRDPIEAAGVLSNTKLVYLVVNRYWWNAVNIQETLRGFADKTWSVRKGENYIFRFEVSTSTKR